MCNEELGAIELDVGAAAVVQPAKDPITVNAVILAVVSFDPQHIGAVDAAGLPGVLADVGTRADRDARERTVAMDWALSCDDQIVELRHQVPRTSGR